MKRSIKEVLQGKHTDPSPLEASIELLAEAIATAKKAGLWDSPSARLLHAAEVVVDSLGHHRDALEASARIVAILEVKDDDVAVKSMPEAISLWKLAAVRARLHQSLPRKPLETAKGATPGNA